MIEGVSHPEPVGEGAIVVRIEGEAAAEVLSRVRAVATVIEAAAIAGVTDVVGSPGRVSVAYDPLAVEDLGAVMAAIAAAAGAAEVTSGSGSELHEIPVAYDGEDLEEVCSSHGLPRERLIAAHTEPEYVVEAIGFLPGFGYLAGLPEAVATPRRATPRRLVPAGAVGIGGGQTGVYPFASPGGWNLIGRSSATLFDARRPRPAVLAVGDRVRFVEADGEAVVAAEHSPPPAGAGGPAAITVVEPGLFTTVQDLGRPGHRNAGVPLSGAADRVSLRLANLLVGNPEGAAGIECTLVGPRLRFECEAIVALVGGEFPGLPAGVATRLAAGTELAIGHATAGCRGYLAVAGGIEVEPVLGSRSTLVAAGLGGFGGRPLRASDRLGVGDRAGRAARPPVRGVAEVLRVMRFGERPQVLRVIPGEQAEACCGSAWGRTFRASSRSNRMGVRLEGEPLPGAGEFARMASVAVFPGTVQLPPDGQPIVLLADAQTIGGYPVLGQVIAADLPRAAQLRPGEPVCFEPVTLAEARAAVRQQEDAVADLRETLR
jgi:antagonist of KipI